MLRVGLLGAGRIGRTHGGNIAAHARATLAAVADADVAAAHALAKAANAAVKTVDAIIDAADIDAVFVCTPTDTHADLIERTVRTGKAVFCEKPNDLDAARVRSCLDVVRKSGSKLMVGFNRRFDPSFAAIRRRIAAGEIGVIELVTILSRDPAPPPPELHNAAAIKVRMFDRTSAAVMRTLVSGSSALRRSVRMSWGTPLFPGV